MLDGYNVIHQLPKVLARPNLEEQRKGLIHFLETQHPQGSLRNKITVVFDGKSEFFGQMESATVKVVFSQDETADDKIKRMVANETHTKNIIVVTNDRSIQYAVQASGAQTSSVEDFIQLSLSKKLAHKKLQEKSSVKKNIPLNLKNKITSEMEDIWLKSKEK